ncbi:MAG: hypothetical protein QG568_80 [Patescibacteria group bacterium]|nr:hypothetical protein [Patescibacteria group bacterium]
MKKLIILVFVIIVGIAVFIFVQKENISSESQNNPATNNNQVSPTLQSYSVPTLSTDKKSISADGKVLLSIDNDTVFNWFQTKSQLCDSYNIDTTTDRKAFCENKSSFKSLTRFSSIAISPDKTKIGFTIESDTLSPDTVVGFFNRTTGNVSLLTNYYLGNEFIDFSPNSANFAYKGGCWEAICAFYIKDSETLKDKIDFIPQEADMRGNYVFVKWLSDNQFQYKIDAESKQYSF